MDGGRRCSRCEWWLAPECHGAPPAPTPGGYGQFPNTLATDWCSLFRLAERLAGGVDLRKPKGDPDA